MAKRKAASRAPGPPKRGSAKAGKRAKAKPGVVVLAERLGSFLGRVRKTADSLLPGPPRKAGKAKKAKRAKRAKP